MDHIAHIGEMRNAYSISVEKSIIRDHLANVDEDGTLILESAQK